jgi:hypothetical protein
MTLNVGMRNNASASRQAGAASPAAGLATMACDAPTPGSRNQMSPAEQPESDAPAAVDIREMAQHRPDDRTDERGGAEHVADRPAAHPVIEQVRENGRDERTCACSADRENRRADEQHREVVREPRRDPPRPPDPGTDDEHALAIPAPGEPEPERAEERRGDLAADQHHAKAGQR